MKKLPNKRVVRLDGVAADPLRFSLAYNASTHHGLPPGVKAAELADFEATGVEDVIKRYNTSGQVESPGGGEAGRGGRAARWVRGFPVERRRSGAVGGGMGCIQTCACRLGAQHRFRPNHTASGRARVACRSQSPLPSCPPPLALSTFVVSPPSLMNGHLSPLPPTPF